MVYMFDTNIDRNNNNHNRNHRDNEITMYLVWNLTNNFNLIISKQVNEYCDSIELSNELIHWLFVLCETDQLRIDFDME